MSDCNHSKAGSYSLKIGSELGDCLMLRGEIGVEGVVVEVGITDIVDNMFRLWWTISTGLI